MADEVDINPQFDNQDLSFFDEGQVDNFAHGIANNKDGLEQWMYSVGETLGLNLPGTMEHYTKRANERRAKHDESRSGNLPGADAIEIVGEVLPWLAVPAGAGSVGKGALMGAGVGASVFQPDSEDSRITTTLVGAGLGGLFGKLTKAKKVEDAIEKVEQKALPSPSALNGPQRALPAPKPTPLVPQGSRSGELLDPLMLPNAQKKLTGKSVKVDDAIEGTFRNLDVAEYKVAQKAKEITHTGKLLAKAKQSINKVRDPAQKKLLASTIRREETTLAKEKYILDMIADKIKGAKTPKALPKPEAKVKDTTEGLQIKGRRLYLDGKPVSKYDMLAQIDDATPANHYISKVDRDYTVKEVKDYWDNYVGSKRNLGKGQAGEVDQRLLVAGGLGVAGGLAGGAATDGDPAGIVAGALAGVTGGALLGKVGTRGASKYHYNKAANKVDDITKGVEDAIKTGTTTKEKAFETMANGRAVLDKFLGSLDTRIRGLNTKVADALSETEYRTHAIAGEYMQKATPFLRTIDKVDLKGGQAVRLKALLLSDRNKAEAYLRGLGKTEAADAVKSVGRVLDDVQNYMKKAGYEVDWKKGYFPRQVVDATQFEKIPSIKSHLDYLAGKKGIELTPFEKEQELTKLFSGAISRGDSASFGRAAKSMKTRHINNVADKWVNAYADPTEGFHNYIEEIVRQAERQRFLKNQGFKGAIGANGENLGSAARMMAKEFKNGDMTAQQADELAELLAIRFGQGEQAPARWIQNFKNITTAGLLGNPISAMTQLGDVALSAYKNGIANTAVGLVKSIRSMRKPLANGLDKETLLGLNDAASDFTSNVKSRDILSWALKYSGFRAMDRLGKNTFINAAMLKNQKMGKEAFFTKWQSKFGGETEGLWQKVQGFQSINKENRDQIGQMLWDELAAVQPISMSAMPEKYLRHPDGRMAYMLQSFTLRLLNTIRNDIIQQAATGQLKEATLNAAKLSSLFTLMNGNVDMAKDFVLGRDQEEIGSYFSNAFLKMFGLSKYTLDTAGREGVGAAISKSIMPPTALLDAIGDPAKAAGMVPIVGKFAQEQMK